MSTCNHCTLHSIRVAAKKLGEKVTLRRDGWLEVYQHPSGVDIDALSTEERRPYKCGISFMEVSNECTC